MEHHTHGALIKPGKPSGDNFIVKIVSDEFLLKAELITKDGSSISSSIHRINSSGLSASRIFSLSDRKSFCSDCGGDDGFAQGHSFQLFYSHAAARK